MPKNCTHEWLTLYVDERTKEMRDAIEKITVRGRPLYPRSSETKPQDSRMPWGQQEFTYPDEF